MVQIFGNTYPVRDKLKSLGGRARKTSSGWVWEVPSDKVEQAQELVTGKGRPAASTLYADFKPTAEQAVLREFIESNSGNLFIRAGAGCGKTTVSLWLLSMLAGSKVMVAFNSDIKEDIAQKAPAGVEVLTMNALGYRALCRTFDAKIRVNKDHLIETVLRGRVSETQFRERYGFLVQVKRLIDFAKGALANTSDQLLDIVYEFDLQFEDLRGNDATSEAVDIALDVLREQAGVAIPTVVDFNDQMWLPVVMGLPLPKFDVVVIDESQDTNPLQLEMLARCVAAHGRVIAVGDPRQCVHVDTPVATPRGSRPAGRLKVGDKVISYRSGKNVEQTIKHVLPSDWTRGIAITTESGRSLTMSPDHQIWATTPEVIDGTAIVYLMYRTGFGFRVGVTNKCESPDNPFGSRPRMEQAERLWVLDVCKDRSEALYLEEYYSLKFGIPTMVFNAKSRRMNVGRCRRLFKEFGQNGAELLKSKDMSFEHPNWFAFSITTKESARRTVHLIAHGGKGTVVSLEWLGASLDEELASEKVFFHVEAGNRRRVRKWFQNYREALRFGQDLAKIAKASLRERLSTHDGPVALLTASALLPSMRVAVRDGDDIRLERIAHIHHVSNAEFVDLDVDDASNFYGDGILSHNCIYSWRGADTAAVDKIVERFDMTVLPLMTTFRCGKAIVREAQRIVPEFQFGPDNHEGLVREIGARRFLSEVEPGDMVLSRTNAPLAAASLALLKAGKSSAITGKADLSTGLVRLVKRLAAESIKDLENKLGLWLDKEIAKISRRLPVNENAISNAQDKVETVLAFCEGAADVDEVLERIDRMYSDGAKGPLRIDLSTTHKAKGRERDRVYVFVDTFMLKKKSSTGEWLPPSTEEENLLYVAITRAKKELVFVDGMRKAPVSGGKGRR